MIQINIFTKSSTERKLDYKNKARVDKGGVTFYIIG